VVRVRVGAQAINEGGHREPGEVFETTAERRRALGGLVVDETGNAEKLKGAE
jgi:hypothetical protein